MEKVYDAHVHYSFDIPIEEMVQIYKEESAVTGTDKFIFLSIPNHIVNGEFRLDRLHNVKGLFLKQAFSPNAHAFAGLEFKKGLTDSERADDYLKQVEEYYAVGFDGMKMLEGDPTFRKCSGIPLDSPVYDKFYSFCEENNFPIIIHIANPDENWDITKASKEAIALGRVYGSDIPSKEQITEEMFGIMKKHKKLRLALAHCGFFGKHIDLAERFLGEYENTLLDITPGGEQLVYISREWDKWLKFFEKYQDRIIYGTDYYAFPKDENWEVAFNRRPKFVRQLFETNAEHDYLGMKFKGIMLDKKLRDKIYRENFIRLFGEPKAIDGKYVAKKCVEVAEYYRGFKKEDIEDVYLKDIEYRFGTDKAVREKFKDEIFKMRQNKVKSCIEDAERILESFSK